jgi:hypothetical protein
MYSEFYSNLDKTGKQIELVTVVLLKIQVFWDVMSWAQIRGGTVVLQPSRIEI